MTVSDLPTLPARRDVRGMTEQLESLRSGQQWLAVTFRTDAYGIFTIEGYAVQSPTVKTFMVGSLFVESSLRPEKTVQAIEQRDAPTLDPEPGQDRGAIQEMLRGVSHGDVVRATFEQQPHGRFTITGAVVQTADADILVVGSWFLSYKGEVPSRLTTLSVLSSATAHRLPIPTRITSWDSDDTTIR